MKGHEISTSPPRVGSVHGGLVRFRRPAAAALPRDFEGGGRTGSGSAGGRWQPRFGLHTELRRVWTVRGKRPVVSRQIKCQWDYLYGALSLIGGEAHFAHVPGVGLDWDASYVRDLAATAPEFTHVLTSVAATEALAR